MRTKVTLVLLFLNVALFFFIFQFERHWRTEDSWKEARRRVLGAESADIRSLQITGPNLDLALEKRSDTWFVTKPIEWPAQDTAISRILNELQFLQHETSFLVRDLAKNGQSLADYGLDEPKLTVTFASGESGRTVTRLQLGDTTKDGVRLYLLSSDGERIHVVNQSFARSLALTFEELHADSVFTIPVFEARSLNLQTAAPASLRIRLRRDGSRWTFETPVIARASKQETELTINALNSLRVQSFVTENPPAIPPSAKPSLRISLEGNQRRETLLLGDALAGSSSAHEIVFHAQLESRPALFTVAIPRALKDTLDHAQEKLRETRLLEFEPRTVTAVTLQGPGQPPLTLQRLETGAQTPEVAAWQIVRRGDGLQGPQTLPADQKAVQRLLEQLSLLSARTFRTDAPRDADLETLGFNRPEREITLTIPGSEPLRLEIGIGPERGDLVFARLPAISPSIYGVDAEILRETPLAPRLWRQRLLRELPAGARITALKLTDLNDDALLLDTAIGPNGKPVQTVAEPAAVQALLDQLRSLRAREFLLDQFVDRIAVAGAERPWRYRLDATITLTGGAGEQTSTTTLFFTPRTGGMHQFAGSPPNEFNAVFEIEQPLLDALWKITEGPRDPGPVTLEP